MFRIFRTIRKSLLARNRFSNYLLYALGEIVLVVIGILVALQINNWNDQRKLHNQELKYLRNIRADLVNNIAEMDSFLTAREGCIEDAGVIISHLEGAPIEDVNDFDQATSFL